jgi:hypothetical protein
MKIYKTQKLTAFSLTFVLLAAAAAPLVLSTQAHAVDLANVLVRFDRMKTSQATTGTVCARPTTLASVEATVQVVFPTGYTLGVAGTFTVDTTNTDWPAAAGGIATVAAWPGIGTATNVTAQTVTFPSTDLASGSTLYCFNWNSTSAVAVKSSATNPNSGTVSTFASGPTLIDSASYSTASIANDQILVTASVPQTFSFALSGTTDALSALSTGSVVTSPTPRTATVNTNAKNGWYVWAQDTNAGLNSASASHNIASNPGANSTLIAGTEGYNTGVTASGTGSTITVDPAFAGGSLGTGGGLDTSLRTLASADGVANNHVLTLKNNAAISGTTPAATDYTDTITVVGAGLF